MSGELLFLLFIMPRQITLAKQLLSRRLSDRQSKTTMALCNGQWDILCSISLRVCLCVPCAHCDTIDKFVCLSSLLPSSTCIVHMQVWERIRLYYLFVFSVLWYQEFRGTIYFLIFIFTRGGEDPAWTEYCSCVNKTRVHPTSTTSTTTPNMKTCSRSHWKEGGLFVFVSFLLCLRITPSPPLPHLPAVLSIQAVTPQ